MIDEMPPVKHEVLHVTANSKIVCYTDGLSDLKGDDGKEILTSEIVKHIKNKMPVEENVKKMLKKLGIPDNNPGLFDDVSIIAADFLR